MSYKGENALPLPELESTRRLRESIEGSEGGPGSGPQGGGGGKSGGGERKKKNFPGPSRYNFRGTRIAESPHSIANEHHPDWSAQDHKDASDFYAGRASEEDEAGNKDKAQKYDDMSEVHRGAATIKERKQFDKKKEGGPGSGPQGGKSGGKTPGGKKYSPALLNRVKKGYAEMHGARISSKDAAKMLDKHNGNIKSLEKTAVKHGQYPNVGEVGSEMKLKKGIDPEDIKSHSR